MKSQLGWEDSFYRLLPLFIKFGIAFEKFKSQRRAKRGEVITGESPSFAQAAHELAQRGFDHIVFGHTHHVGEVDLGAGNAISIQAVG